MPPTFLTPSGYEKLQEELEKLRTVKRQEVAARLREAMEDGADMGVDLDAEYEAAKNEQAFVEGRIQELEMLLANARVIVAKIRQPKAGGARVINGPDGGEEDPMKDQVAQGAD